MPAWMVTFADLMALMMTFFVLLYSFSRIDEERYKTIVDSMAKGFDGIQWIKRQLTEDEVIGPEPGIVSPPLQQPSRPVQEQKPTKKPPEPADAAPEQTIEQPSQPTQDEILFTRLNQDLQKEIASGLVYVEKQGSDVMIRFPEEVSFPSGSDKLVRSFIPIIHRISAMLHNSQGDISIAGHTDDQPIATQRFRSNWELSAARAVSVAHRLFETRQINKDKISVIGHADTRPLVENNSADNRAKNRRVEIIILGNN